MSKCIQCGKEIGNASGHICKPEAPTLNERCYECETGFPIKDGYHYGTQSLGMIPMVPCKKKAAKPEPPPAQAPREWRIVSHYSTDYDAFKWTMTHGSTIDRTATNQEIIHVIEYAAYEALERELAKWKPLGEEFIKLCKENGVMT